MPLIFLVIFAVMLAVTMWARGRYRRIYDQELKNVVKLGITGSEVAERILRENGITDVKVVRGRGLLADFYDPEKKRLSLSPQHFNGSTYSAIGVAAHEVGHALQHKDGFRPLLWRVSAIKATMFLSLPLVMIGAVMIAFSLGQKGSMVLAIGWSVIALYNFATIPTEMDATERVKRILADLKPWRGLDEKVGIERVMNAACAIYIDGVFTVISWVGSLILPWMGPTDDDAKKDEKPS
ncbi:MAG: zinc metallopeptidase [Verrucomicrobiales bacterium]